jgi:hypothetical protein
MIQLSVALCLHACNASHENCSYLVTKSDVRGYIETVMLDKYTYQHSGLSDFMDTLVDDLHINIIFVTARPLVNVKQTKKLVTSISTLNRSLGPVFFNPAGVCGALYSEVILRRSDQLKASILKSILDLFQLANSSFLNASSIQSRFILGAPTHLLCMNRLLIVIAYISFIISYYINSVALFIPKPTVVTHESLCLH